MSPALCLPSAKFVSLHSGPLSLFISGSLPLVFEATANTGAFTPEAPCSQRDVGMTPAKLLPQLVFAHHLSVEGHFRSPHTLLQFKRLNVFYCPAVKSIGESCCRLQLLDSQQRVE